MTIQPRPLDFNCPRCPRKLVHIRTSGNGPNAVHIYVCPVHGHWRLAQNPPGFRPLDKAAN
jgi:hypothetical protein